MLLRPININDITEINRLIDLAEAFHAQSAFKNLTFSRCKVFDLIMDLTLLCPTKAYIHVAEKDGQIIGGMFAVVSTPHYSNDSVIQDYGIYVDPAQRSSRVGFMLINDMLRWAATLSVKEIWLGETAGIETEAVRRLYEHFGFKQQGILYRRIV